MLESFKLNLYQNEIYCFTPKGELKILLQAQQLWIMHLKFIHRLVCTRIGAKVNGKIVNWKHLLRAVIRLKFDFKEPDAED